MAISVDVIISGKTATSVEGNTTAAVITTNLLEDKLGTKGGIISGSLLPHQTDTVDLGSPSKRFLNLYTKTAHLDANSLKLGDSATISAGAGGGFSFDTEGTTTFGDLLVRNLTVTGTHSTIETTDLAIKDNIIVINSGEAGAGITLTSGGLVIDRGTLESATILFNDNTDRFEFNFPISVDGSELALVPNLIITGQTLQGQITSNDGDIVTLTTNLASTGSTVAANIITSGQTLTTNLASTGTTVAANLVASGQTLTTNLASTGTTVAANLVTSGQYLTSEVGTLSGLSVFHSMTGNFATHFHNLDDIYLAGNQGKYLKVNSAGDGLSYDLPPVTGVGGEGGGATHFTGLVDTPNGYSGIGALPEDGGLVVFNSTSEQIAYASSGAFASDADLISSGNTLDSKRDVLSGNLISSGNALDAARDILSGNLISTGNNLENQIISNDGDIATLTSNLVSTGNTLDSQRDTLSGNLISTGNNLEAQITSNDGDISTLQDQKFDKIGGTLSGSMTPDASGTLNLGTRALPFQSGYFDELWVGGNTLQIGDESSISAGPDGFSFDTTGTTTFGDVSITGDLGVSGNFTLGDTTTDKITARGDLYVEDDAFFADAVKITGSLTVDGTASAAAPTLDTHLTTKLYVDTTGDAITTNLASTGNNLQAQITTDIANLISSGAIVDGISGNLISSGQTLQTQITSNDSDITSLTSNLVTTGQTLTTTTDTISSNLITSGQTLQTQITSNDSDISSITTNLASTGSTLAADIVTVSGLTFGNDSDIATITSNLVSTGQTLTTEINTVSGLITSNDGDITVLQTATGTLKTSVDANTASISSNDSDITTLTSNLVSTGTIVDDISGNLIVSGQTLTNLISAQDVSTVSSNLITTGQSLTTDIGTVSGLITTNDTELNNLRTATGLLNTQVTSNDGDISNLTSNLITSGQNLTDDIATVSGLAAGGELVDALSGNLITTGQTLQSQISSNDSDVSTLTTNLVSTGQSITSEIAIVSGLTTSNDTDIANLTTNLATTGQTLQTQITSNDSDISSFTSNIVTTGQTLQTQITSNDSDISTLDSTTVKLTSNQTIAGNKTFSDTVTITDLNVTGTQTTISATNLAIKDNLIEINSGEVGAGITLVSGGITINRGSADNANILFDDSTDQFELNFPIATEGNLVATAPNLISTGQTLQTQITSNDGDISTLTSNIVTTGQTLQTQITSNDSDISTLTSNLSTTDSNLITTGQTLQTQITSNDSDISTLTTNLITTGQTLQTQITSNDSDVSTLTSNLISTGQTLTTDIGTVSGLITSNDTELGSLRTATGSLQTQVTSNDSDITSLTTNLVTTGQTLQTQITSNDSDISTLTTNLISTGSTLNTKIDTLSGVVALDSETGHLADTTVLESFSQGLNVGTSSNLASRKLHVVGDIEISGTIYQSGSVFEGGGGGGGSSTFLGLSDTPGSFTAGKYLSVNSAGNAVEMVNTIQSGFATIDQGYFTGFDLAGTATGIVQNASGSVVGLDLADNKWDVSIIEETDAYNASGDSNFNSVSLLLHFDGVNGATTFTESSSSTHAITGFNGASLSTTKKKFGDTSLYLNTTAGGSGGDYITVPNSSDFHFGSNDFTIEFWFNPSSIPSSNVAELFGISASNSSDANGSLHIDLTTASKIDFSYWHSSAGNRFSLTSSSSVSTNTWHHIAAVRDGNTIRLFLDGSAVGTTSWSVTAYDFAGDVHIGERSYITSYGNVNGYLDDYRITKGVARYTSAFTPHTTAHLDSLLVAVTEAKYIGQIGGWDDADVDYGIKKISNSELSVKKMSSTTPDRAYVNVQKLGAVGQGIAFNQLYTGDGVTTNYLLTDSVPNTQDLLVSVQGLIQTPNIDYTMAGNTGVSFTTGVTSGDEVSLRYLALGPSGATGPTGPAGSAPDLTASGFALNANLAATGAIVDDISGNLITSGQTLQTQITSNDSDISSLTTNLISTGQSITSEIAIVSGLTTSNDTDIATLTTNIGTTGQTLTSEIATVSGLIPATVVDGAGVTGYGARWFDGNTLTTGTLYDDGTKVGIGTNNPSVPLHVAVDGTAEILLERTTGMGGMPSQIKIKSVGSEWSLANNLAGNGKFSIKDVTDNRHVMVFDGEGVVTTNNLEPLNGNDSGYLGSSSKKWKQVYFGILEADTATFSDQIKFYNGSDKCFQIETDSGKDTYINSYGSANFIQFKQNSAAVLSLYETFLAIPDSTQLRFGGGSDLRFYHDGNNSYIWQVGVGALNIKSSVTDGNIVFTADRGDGGGTFDYFSVNGGDTTYAGGVTTAYTKWPDNSRIALGGGKDLQLYHDGSNSHIKNTGSLYIASETSGDLYLRSDDDIFIQPQGGENGITLTGNGAVTLYYDNAVKLATASTGVTVTGLLTSTTATFSTTGETNPIRIESDANCGISLDTTQANGDELVIRNIVNGTTPMFQWRNQDTSTNLMQLDAINVRLGIGTVSPKESLHVRGQTILDNNTTAVASAIPTTVLVTDQSDATIGFAPRAGGTEASAIIGIDDSDSDKFKISYTTTDIGAVSHFTMDSSGKVGIGTVDPNKVLHVVGDIEISGAIYQSGSLFEGGGGGGGGGGSSTFVGLSDTPGSFTANRILSVNSAGNAVETAYNVSTISGHQSVDQGYFTGFSLAGAATGIIQNASGSVAGLNLADNKWDVSIVEESDSQAITGDANWSSVKLLLPVDGTNNATTTTDSSSNAHTVTLSNGAKISTTKSKWGGSSLFLDGTNDYGEVAYDADFDFGNADFTVELWYYPLSQQSDSYIIAVNDNSSQSAWAQAVIEGVSVGSGMKIEGGSYDSGMKWTAYSSEIALNTWHHLAYVRYNNKVYMYVNGTATDSGTTIGSLRNNSTSVLIGRRSHGTYTNAYLDDIRITKGLARYTANFTPPTEALGTVINTVDTKYISQIGGWDDTDVDYGIKKISNSELSIKKMGADDVTRPIDRLYVNVQKLGAIGQGVAFDQLYTGDGSATAFTLPASVPSARDLMVSVEGLVQIPTVDYSVSATTLTFTTGVTSGNLVDARYLALGPSGAAGPSGAGGGGGAVSSATNRFTGNGVISGFEMTRSVSTADEIFVYVNGLFQDSGDNFTITNGTGLYFTNGDIASGDKVIVRHIY